MDALRSTAPKHGETEAATVIIPKTLRNLEGQCLWVYAHTPGGVP